MLYTKTVPNYYISSFTVINNFSSYKVQKNTWNSNYLYNNLGILWL